MDSLIDLEVRIMKSVLLGGDQCQWAALPPEAREASVSLHFQLLQLHSWAPGSSSTIKVSSLDRVADMIT